ncbi:MAG: acylneuraminate cytidylyltransferase family protein [Peptococcaceae bacterium]|nr:acylneuraminate cytidylyltransferase family protein [Peptococcaceae bacterium]
MIDGKSVLAVIPARGGSKGVPRKNVRMVAGKPLIAWTIEEARKSLYIDRLVLSSEDEEIIAVAGSWGCEAPFVRPPELARDDTPGIEPVLHAIKSIPGYDYVVVLQPTSPMRTAGDIDGCIKQCARQGTGACVSVTEPDKSPYWMYVLDAGKRMKPLINTDINISRRQDLPKVFVLNGAVYVAGCDWLLKTRTFLHEETTAFPMDKLNSIDIDSELDIKICDMLLSKL